MNYIKETKRLGGKIVKYYSIYDVGIEIVEGLSIPNLRRHLFTIKIVPGTRVQDIFDRAKDVQVVLGIPLLQPFMEGFQICIAASEYDIKENRLLPILRSSLFVESNLLVPYAVGYDLWGEICVVDLVELRHLLIAGPTGSGKSVALQCLILSIIVHCPIFNVNLLLFDIGGGSLSLFSELPHLSHPIVEDAETGMRVLTALVNEMERRYTLDAAELKLVPYIVCLIDEFDLFIANANGKMESQCLTNLINNLLRRGRKAKVIMILASHNPTLKNVKVDLGMIVSRISFQYAKHQSSTNALGVSGAHKLSGDGAMLFKSKRNLVHLQGAYVEPFEIEKILSAPPTDCDDSNKFVIDGVDIHPVQVDIDMVLSNKTPARDTKELTEIIIWTLKQETVSANLISKQFRIGNRAGDIVDEMFRLGVVSDKFANLPRTVLPKCVADLSPEVIALLKDNGYSLECAQGMIDSKEVDFVELQ